MRTAGLIGGVSWHSTLEYYRVINAAVARAKGGAASAKLVLVSLNFEEVLRAGRDADSGEHARIYLTAARALQRAGAVAHVTPIRSNPRLPSAAWYR